MASRTDLAEELIITLNFLREKAIALEEHHTGLKGDLAGVKSDLSELQSKIVSLESALDDHKEQNAKVIKGVHKALNKNTKSMDRLNVLIKSQTDE